MIIDINNKENLKLKSSRDTFLQSLIFINSIDKRNISNVYYELTRTTNIKDKDLNFVFHFLNTHNHLTIEDEIVHVKNKFNPNEFIIDLCAYYLSLIQSNKEINNALFLTSDFTIENDSIIINIESVSIVYRPFFLVLQKLELLETSGKKGFVVVSDYAIAKKILERPLKKISQKDFDKELEQRKIRGSKAELFVMNFEGDKLKETNYSPRRMSLDNVGLGYDIESYETDGTNIFIEVKALKNGEMFHWSKNEIKVSKRLGKHYLIYTIQFNKESEPVKIKRVIKDPYSEIFELGKFTKKPSGDYMISI
jgi:hypothetical protein